MTTHDRLLSVHQKHGAGYLILIDPDKINDDNLPSFVRNATEAINRNLQEKSRISQPTFRWGQSEPPKPTLVELAAETKKNRRVSQKLRLQDLQRIPALSIIGSDEPSIAVRKSSENNESEWRRQSSALREDLDTLRQNKAAADAACRKAREQSLIKLVKPRRGSVTIVDPSEEPAECEHANKVRRQLEKAEQRYEDFEDRARQADVPWQWLDR